VEINRRGGKKKRQEGREDVRSAKRGEIKGKILHGAEDPRHARFVTSKVTEDTRKLGELKKKKKGWGKNKGAGEKEGHPIFGGL